MQRVSVILRGFFGLVVDDGTLALAVLVWSGAVWALVAGIGLPPAGGSVALFVGLACILVENVWRRARR